MAGAAGGDGAAAVATVAVVVMVAASVVLLLVPIAAAAVNPRTVVALARLQHRIVMISVAIHLHSNRPTSQNAFDLGVV